MALERTYTVPLRRAFRQAANYKRTNKAVKAVRAFLAKHMKTSEEDVKLGQHLNEHLWARGIRNPPARVRVHARKDDEGIVRVELEGKEFSESVKPQEATEEPKGLRERLQAAVGKDDGKKDEGNDEKK